VSDRQPPIPAPATRPPDLDPALAAMPRGECADMRRRIALTYQYLGAREVAWRALTFPIRFTPLRHRLRLGSVSEIEHRRAAAWYREHGRPVSIVIPTYGDPRHVARAVRSIRRTTDRGGVRIVVVDDASPAADVERLQAVGGIDVLVLGADNVGFAANVNRGLQATDAALDVVVLNADVIAREHWLDCLQYAACAAPENGIVGARLVYPDGRIQHAGVHRNRDAPQWFDHRFRFEPADYGPANVTGCVLAVTGACMYVKRAVLDAVGGFDERYPMAYEDVDLCLRAWHAGFRVLYFPPATLCHLESATRGAAFGARERASQEAFWERWEPFFDARGRDVRTAEGRVRAIYVTEGTGIGGGHRDVFEHLNGLSERGHDVALFTLGEAPDWFELHAPVRTFADYEELTAALAAEDAIKIATWWNTSAPVWRGSLLRGIPVFFVQDIETSYYPDDERTRHAVLASYRREFRYMTISRWNAERLGELGLDATLVAPGIALDSFRPLAGVRRRDDMLLALGRTNPLKNLSLTIGAWKAMNGAPRPELCLFGGEPELGAQAGARYVARPSDAAVNVLLNEATVFVQTSTHEGFSLPPLEAMAAGCAVVCTDSDGNRDFCVDGANCLMPEATVAAVSASIARLLDDPQLRARLGAAGRRTANGYAWERRIDELEAFLEAVAGAPATAAVTAPRRSGAPRG
jgi:GT2 family glycosyltransferase/glycosyltransferase involved in cell wall biosynthesis